MAKNDFLARQKARDRMMLEIGLQCGRQQIIDMMSLVLHNPKYVDKDTFGKGRLMRVVKGIGDYLDKYEPAYQSMIEVGMNPNVVVCNESMTSKKKGEAYVKLLTHTYLRGTNLQKKVVILDESQNYTVAELKKVLTR